MVEISNRISGPVEAHELRSVAQLRMLHALATRLNALDDVAAIGEAITTELKTLIDYHNCRIYLLLEDGLTLWPVTFRGELTEYESETPEELVTQVGEGITGYAAITGQTYYAPDALHDDRGLQIEGTDEIDESLLAVPLKVGDKVTGVIVLSKLGADQFEEDDQRVLEVLASHASVAYENASLLQKEREAAKTASALLGLSQSLSGAGNISSVLARVVAAVPSIIDGAGVVAYRRDQKTGDFIPTHHRGLSLDQPSVPADLASRFLASFEEPFVIEHDMAEQVPTEFWLTDEPMTALVAPMSWEPDGFGALVVLASGAESTFSERDRDLARHRPDRLARLGQRAARDGARAVPRARGDARRDLLGGRAADARVHVPVETGVLGPGTGAGFVGVPAAAMGRPHRPGRPREDDLDAPGRRRHPRRRSRPGVPDPGARRGDALAPRHRPHRRRRQR